MKRHTLFLVAAFFLLLQFFPFFMGKTLFFGDNYSLMVPGKLFTVEWLKQGTLPLWNPTIFSGIPWIGDVNQSIFYPTTLLFLILSPAIALNLTIILHELLAFFGMVVLVRTWRKDLPTLIASGLLWMFSTHMMGSIHNLSTLQSVPWFPWIIWAGLNIGKKKSAPIIFGLLIAAQFAGGYPQHVLLAIGTAVLFSAVTTWKKIKFFDWLKNWTFAAVITIGLSSVIWLPFIDVFVRSTRMLQTAAQAQVGSLHPVMLAKIFLATVFDNARAGMKWGPAWSGQPNAVFYVGWFGIFTLGWVTTRLKKLTSIDWFLVIFSAITLVLSFGSYLPYYTTLQEIIPILRVGRYPSMLLVITNILLIIIIALNFSKIKITKTLHKRFSLLIGLTTLLSAALLLITWSNPNMVWELLNNISGDKLASSLYHTFDRDVIIMRTLLTQLFLVSGIALLGWYFFYKRKLFIVALLIGLDLVISTHGMLIFADNSVYSSKVELQEDIASGFSINQGRTRFLTRNSNMPYADYGSYWEALVVREPFSDSYIDRNELDNQIVLKQLRNGLTPDWNMVEGIPMIHGYTTLLPQDYAAIWQKSELPRINFVDSIQSSNPLLAQWAVSQYVVDTWFPLYGEELPDVRTASVGNLDFYAIQGALDRFRYEDDVAAELQNREETPNTLILTVSGNNHSKLIIADRFDKDWRATVNGQEVEIENYNGMRRIQIDPGENQIKMWYEPRAFYFGLGISALTALLCEAFLVFNKKEKISS